MVLFSLGLFHEITNRLSCMQHIHVHTPSGDQYQFPSPISSHSAPFSVLISIRRSSRRGKVHKLPHPTSLSDSSLRLPLSCRTAESSPHSHILVSLAAKEAVLVRIWYDCKVNTATIYSFETLMNQLIVLTHNSAYIYGNPNIKVRPQ